MEGYGYVKEGKGVDWIDRLDRQTGSEEKKNPDSTRKFD
jgi:hypothetical protein